jgi:hypothetical protein
VVAYRLCFFSTLFNNNSIAPKIEYLSDSSNSKALDCAVSQVRVRFLLNGLSNRSLYITRRSLRRRALPRLEF